MCISGQCYDTHFLAVIVMKQNYWNYYTDLSSVGGLLGLGYSDDSSLWRSMIGTEGTQLGVFLGWESDLDWWLSKMGKTKVKEPSILSFGK